MPFDIAYNSATYLTVMIIAFSYVITSPLTCVLGAVYFNIRYFIDKYNILCLFYVDYESKCQTAKYSLRFLILSVAMFQIFTSCMLMSVATISYVIVGAVLCGISFVALIVLLCCEGMIYRDEHRVYSTEIVDYEAAKELYTHPVEKKGETEMKNQPGESGT